MRLLLRESVCYCMTLISTYQEGGYEHDKIDGRKDGREDGEENDDALDDLR